MSESRGDEIHLVHVIPRMQLAAIYGAPPVDFLPQQNPVAYEQLLAEAERFVTARFSSLLQEITPDPVVHIIKVPCTPFRLPFAFSLGASVTLSDPVL